jgi:hypothetical protein
VRWSPGLRSVIFGSDALADRTDGELAAENVDGDLQGVIPIAVWSRIRIAGLDHGVLVAADTLAAERGPTQGHTTPLSVHVTPLWRHRQKGCPTGSV